jgi:hypothetical protein
VTHESVTQTYALDGAVTEAVETQVVSCTELLSSATQMVDDGNTVRQVGGFVLSALGLNNVPKLADRIIWRGRRFLVTEVVTARFKGSVVAYRLSAGDIGGS